MEFFLRGLILGFSIAAPVGPIGVLCIRRTLSNGRMSGLLSGLGAASADALYGTIAALGITLITNLLVSWQTALRLFGGAFLIYLGVRTYLAAPASPQEPQTNNNKSNPKKSNSSVKLLAADYASTFLLTLTNPMTIISFAAIFAGLGIAEASSSYSSAIGLVSGVFCGSAAWWLILSTIADVLRKRFLNPGALRWVNRISGSIIIIFGLIAILSKVS